MVAAAALADAPAITGARVRAHLDAIPAGEDVSRLFPAYLAAQLGRAGVQAAGDDGTFFRSVRGARPPRSRPLASRLVVGWIPGESGEAVVLSAPLPGPGAAPAERPRAVACAALLEIASVWAALPVKPKRGAVFLFAPPEGWERYAASPLVAPGRTAAALHLSGIALAGRTADLTIHGRERTTLAPLAEHLASRFRVALAPDEGLAPSGPWALARAGIPLLELAPGARLLRPRPDRDDFAGAEQVALFALTLALDVANAQQMPDWKGGDPLRPVRTRSLAATRPE